MATAPALCSSCGQPLPSRRLDGFCPACLWRGLFVDALANSTEGEAAAFASLQLPGLTVVGEIARGGMGIVYRARQQSPERDVALKMLLPHQVASPAAKERFRAEARAIAALDHPGILPVHQLGELDGLPWFTMKLAGGGSLAQRKERFAGDWRASAQLIARLADAIQFAHDRGILHRDLKPGNILFDETGQAFVSDFGLAKFLDADATLTTSRAVLGTPGYLAPELLLHTSASATTAADVYGLGALLYELLYGRPPFEAPNIAALLKQISESAPAFTNSAAQRAPRDLEVVCRKCLEKEPARRYASARELAADLRRWLEGRPIFARPAPLAEVFAAWAKRNPVVAALALLLVLALVVGGTALGRQNLKLAAALRKSEMSQRAERDSLRAALIAQAKAVNESKQAGKRGLALAALRRAAAMPLPTGQANDLADLREAAITALCGPDLVPERRWPLTRSATASNSFVLFTPDLERYVVTQGDVTDVLNVSNQVVISQIPMSPRIPPNNLAISRDGRLLAILTPDNGVSVWDIATTNLVLTEPAEAGNVLAVDFHPDGKALAVVRSRGPVEWRDLAGRLRGTWPVTNAVAARFSPGASRVALVTSAGVEVWQVDPPTRISSAPLRSPVHRVDWHPEGISLLAASRQQNMVLVLDIFRGAVLAVHSGHGLDAARFEFHPSGKLAASVGREGYLSLWDPKTGRDLVTLKAAVDALGFSADGRRLGYSLTQLELGTLTLQTSAVFRAFADLSNSATPTDDLLVTPEGAELITLSGADINRWDIQRREQTERIIIPGTGRIPVVALLPDGRHLIYGRADEPSWLRALTNGPPGITNPATSLSVCVMDVSAAGDWLVVEPDDTALLWPQGDASRSRIIGQRLGSMQLKLSPDSRWSVSSLAANRFLRVLDTATGKTVRMDGLTNVFRPTLSSAWFSPDGKSLLTGNALEFNLRETGTWRRLHTWRLTLYGITGCAAFSPDSQRAALEIEHDVFHLVEPASGQTLLRLRPPTELHATAAVFSPDGTQLYVAGDGPAVFQWDLAALRRELSAVGLVW